MKNSEFVWQVEQWLLEFDCDVDAHFMAGDEERGMQAYRGWYDRVRRSISAIDEELARAFTRTAYGPPLTKRAQALTPRAKFIKSAGGRSRDYLRDLKSRLLGNTVTAEFSGKPVQTSQAAELSRAG
jgi:hypothetical protein